MKYFLFTALIFTTVSYAQIKNVPVSNESANRPEEVSIAINLLNPLQLAAGANISYFFRSENGGKNWDQSLMASPLGEAGDPCLVYDDSGNLYYVHLSYPINSYWLDRIVVQKSTDNGLNWSAGTGAGLNSPKQQDKAWLGVDMSSPNYKNNIYLTWTEFDKYGSNLPGDSSRIMFSKSTDFGRSWLPAIKVSDREGNCLDGDSTVEGAVPCVGPDGEIYVSWSGPLGIMFDKSLDGGKSFGSDIFVTSQPGGWDFNIPGIYRCNGLPVTACDTSKSPFRGTIYVMWSSQNPKTGDTDVFLIKSSDKGETWGGKVKVNDDNSGRHQFFPWMTIDQTNGNIYIVFYDRRNTAGAATDVYMAKSGDGGNSFDNFKISQSAFTPSQNIFFGDYINVAAYNKKVCPIWMRLDSGVLSVWAAPFSDTASVVNVEKEITLSYNFKLFSNYPNPFNPSTTIGYELAKPEKVNLSVYDILGRKVETLVDEYKQPGIYEVDFNASKNRQSLVSGLYIYRLEAGGYTNSKTMILLK